MPAMIVFATSVGVSAQTGNVALDMQRADSIRVNCRAAQATMQQIARNDAVLRVNRGRAYEKMLKLMYSLNARVAVNNKSVPALAAITASFEKELNIFRTDFVQYDDAINRAIKVDCMNQPVTFYEALIDARVKRVQVHVQEVALETLMNQYQQQVTDIAKSVGAGAQQ